MGQNASRSSGSCTGHQVWGQGDNLQTGCQPAHWITENAPPFFENVEIQRHFLTTRHLLRHRKTMLHNTNFVMGVTRWIFMDGHYHNKGEQPDDSTDLKARKIFIIKMTQHPFFHWFLTHSEASELALHARQKAVVYLDADVPGRINVSYMAQDGDLHTAAIDIEKHWLKDRPSLKALVDSSLREKDVKLMRYHSALVD